MTNEELDFISSMNMCDEISNEAYKKIVCNCEVQEPCSDTISRQAVLEALEQEEPLVWCDGADEIAAHNQWESDVDTIKNMPTVQPKIKVGHWIDVMIGDMQAQACDQCKTFYPLAYTGGGHKYCPNCGAKMIEPQKSEET